MGRIVAAALRQKFFPLPVVSAPGPVQQIKIPPRSPELVSSYVNHVGGDPLKYSERIPAHFYPQWAFSLLGKLLEGSGYPLLMGLNAGCSYKVNAPLPLGEPFQLKGRLAKIDDNGKRAILDLEFVTSTRQHAEALEAHLYIFVPLKREKPSASITKEKPRVPNDVKEVVRWSIGANAGFEFAKLTGDFNPVHWIAPYAKAVGFKNSILQGFATFARAVEALEGTHGELKEVSVSFTRPVVLPAEVGLYEMNNRFWIGDAPGAYSYCEGTYSI
jgi:hypothetical protein